MTNDYKNELIAKVAKSNSRKYSLLKASEEFMELALVLTQQRVKKGRDYTQAIIDEIGDCKIRLAILEELFSKDMIDARVEHKLSKFQEYLDKHKYKNHI